jgi:hypothetical protein
MWKKTWYTHVYSLCVAFALALACFMFDDNLYVLFCGLSGEPMSKGRSETCGRKPGPHTHTHTYIYTHTQTYTHTHTQTHTLDGNNESTVKHLNATVFDAYASDLIQILKANVHDHSGKIVYKGCTRPCKR